MLELHLLIDQAEGALVRLLGTIERRGFRIEAMRTEPDARGTRVHLRLPSDSRPVDILLRQLQRLVDVREAGFDIVRADFALPTARAAASASLPQPQRSGMSFLGIPERVSVAQAGAV